MACLGIEWVNLGCHVGMKQGRLWSMFPARSYECECQCYDYGSRVVWALGDVKLQLANDPFHVGYIRNTGDSYEIYCCIE